MFLCEIMFFKKYKKPGNFVKHGSFEKKHGICKNHLFWNGEFLGKTRNFSGEF